MAKYFLHVLDWIYPDVVEMSLGSSAILSVLLSFYVPSIYLV